MTSRCPLVMGSYDPGQTAIVFSSGLIAAMDPDRCVPVDPLPLQRERQPQRRAPVALHDDARARSQQRGQKLSEPALQALRPVVGGVDEDEIVFLLAAPCALERRQRLAMAHLGLGRTE